MCVRVCVCVCVCVLRVSVPATHIISHRIPLTSNTGGPERRQNDGEFGHFGVFICVCLFACVFVMNFAALLLTARRVHAH